MAQNKVEKVVVLYKDRLLRFGSEQQELVEDLVQIITVFSCKLQRKRANKARKLVKELIEEGGEENDKNNQGNVTPK